MVARPRGRGLSRPPVYGNLMPVALYLSAGFGVRFARRRERNRGDRAPLQRLPRPAAHLPGPDRTEEDADERTHRGGRILPPAATPLRHPCHQPAETVPS